jgi:hypothetical protein
MRARSSFSPWVLVLCACACRKSPTPAPIAALPLVDSFEEVAAGSLPRGWRACQTIGELDAAATPARWEALRVDGAPSGSKALRVSESKNRGEVFNLCLRDAPAPADLALSVKLHADGGVEDQGGGLVWRAVDAGNYYVARWNPIGQRKLVLFRVERSFRVQLQYAQVDADAAAWHTLSVTMKGKHVVVAFDGAERLDWSDDTFTSAGRVGVWTRSDASTSFDDFTIAAP